MDCQTPGQDRQAQPKTLGPLPAHLHLAYFSMAKYSDEGVARAQASSPGCLPPTLLDCAEPGSGGGTPEPLCSELQLLVLSGSCGRETGAIPELLPLT